MDKRADLKISREYLKRVRESILKHGERLKI